MSYLVIIVLTRRPEALPARSRDLSSDHASETVAYRRKNFVVPICTQRVGVSRYLVVSFYVRTHSKPLTIGWKRLHCAGTHSKPFLICMETRWGNY